MTEDVAFDMSEADPSGLLDALEAADMPAHELTFAAEIGGRIPGPRTANVLLRLLDHTDAVVREGAIYGLQLGHVNDNAVADRLAVMAETDPSPGVRLSAREAIEP